MKRVIIAAAVILSLWAVAAQAYEAALSARLSQDGSENRLELDLTNRLAFRVFTLEGPKRVVVDFPEVDWRLDPPRPGPAMQLIDGVRFGLVRPGASRLVIDLKRAATVAEAFTAEGGGRAPVLARVLGAGAMLVMGAALGHALVNGDFATEGAALVASPWGLATLAEAYVGFALLGGWMACRERPLPATVWIVALLLGGNLVGGAYVLRAAITSRGDAWRFWTGTAHRAR